MNYNELSPTQLVNLFADKKYRNEAIVALIGGITAGELRSVIVSEESKSALITGLKHPSTKVRWWCIQLMDHIADESYVEPLIESAFHDPSAKNRRHAIHALTCRICKPDACALNVDISTILSQIIQNDSDWSVKMLSLEELEELGDTETISSTLESLSGKEQIQLKTLQKTQSISQQFDSLLAFTKQIANWRGRAAYELIQAAEKLLEAAFSLLVDDNAQSLRHKLESSKKHMELAVKEAKSTSKP